MRPQSRTAILSAARMVDRRWATTRVVRPVVAARAPVSRRAGAGCAGTIEPTWSPRKIRAGPDRSSWPSSVAAAEECLRHPSQGPSPSNPCPPGDRYGSTPTVAKLNPTTGPSTRYPRQSSSPAQPQPINRPTRDRLAIPGRTTAPTASATSRHDASSVRHYRALTSRRNAGYRALNEPRYPRLSSETLERNHAGRYVFRRTFPVTTASILSDPSVRQSASSVVSFWEKVPSEDPECQPDEQHHVTAWNRALSHNRRTELEAADAKGAQEPTV